MSGTLPRAVNDPAVVTPVSVTRLIQLNTTLETTAGYLFPAGVVSGGLVAATTGFGVEVGVGVFATELTSLVLAGAQAYAAATNPSTTIRLWGKVLRTAATQANRADPDTYTLSLTHTSGGSYATEPASGPWFPLADWSTDGSGVTGTIDNEPAGKRLVRGRRETLEGWWQDNVAASQTGVALTRSWGAAAFPGKWIALRAGSITGVLVKSNAARAAGTLTVEATKNGTGVGLTAVLNATNTTFKASSQAAGLDTFVAGDELAVQITTDGSWSPTTADVRASIEIET